MPSKDKTNETNYVVVDFMDLDFDRFGFKEKKKEQNYGYYVPITYDGKKLYTKMPRRFMPFKVGVQVSNEKDRLNGCSLAFAFKGEKQEGSDIFKVDDPLWDKMTEFNEFIMSTLVKNKGVWALGNITRKKLFNPKNLGEGKYKWF